MNSSAAFWLFVLVGPLVCAAAGAALALVLAHGRHERQLDAVYAEGWDAGRRSAWLDVDAPAYGPPEPEDEPAQLALFGSVADAETLAALPALHHEGGRGTGPHRPAPADADLAAIAAVRAEFARIRMRLGLPLRT